MVEKNKGVCETLWIVLDNTKVKLRIGAIYAPQESRTSKEILKIMYKEIGEQLIKAKEKQQIPLIVGDFNCKIGDAIAGNRKDVTKGGRLLLKMVETFKLKILNGTEKCLGLWTRSEGGKSSVLDYALIDENSESALQTMLID